MKKIIVYISLIVFMHNCSSTENKKILEIENKYSDSYEKWSLDTFSKKKQDSVLYFLNELIKNTKDDFYKIEKVKFLCRLESYKEALLVFDTLEDTNSISVDLLKGLIEIKEDSNKETVVLQNIYNKYENEKLEIEEQFYKIALDCYFKGKNFAFNEIEEIIKNDKISDNNKYIFITLKEIIQNEESNLDILFILFNLKTEEIDLSVDSLN